MHAMIIPAISPEARPRDFFFFLEPRGRTSTVGVAVGAGIGTCPRVGFRVGPGVGPGVIVGAWVSVGAGVGKFIHLDHGWLRRLGMLLCAMIKASHVTRTVQIARMAAYGRDEMPRDCHTKKILTIDVHERRAAQAYTGAVTTNSERNETADAPRCVGVAPR